MSGMRRLVATLGLGLGLTLASPGHACETDLEPPVIDHDGVQVWTCPISGNSLLAFEAHTLVQSTLSGLVGLLMDSAAGPKWVFRMNRIDMLRKDETAGTFLLRAESDFWPLKDRDVYLEGKVTQQPTTLAVSIDSRSTPAGRFPDNPDFVRMPSMIGQWEFRPAGQGKVLVIMSGRADPGGSIPGFLVNLVIQETPYRTLLGLRRQVSERRYQQMRIPGIREPQR